MNNYEYEKRLQRAIAENENIRVPEVISSIAFEGDTAICYVMNEGKIEICEFKDKKFVRFFERNKDKVIAKVCYADKCGLSLRYLQDLNFSFEKVRGWFR